MERKEFIQKLIIRGSLGTLIPTLLMQSCEEDSMDDLKPSGGSSSNTEITIDLQDPFYADLLNEGGSVTLDGNIIVINKGNNEFVALSNKCTHQGCTVVYNSVTNTLPCPCHGSLFSINGSVLNGPASSPLRKYSINLDMNTLTITA